MKKKLLLLTFVFMALLSFGQHSSNSELLNTNALSQNPDSSVNRTNHKKSFNNNAISVELIDTIKNKTKKIPVEPEKRLIDNSSTSHPLENSLKNKTQRTQIELKTNTSQQDSLDVKISTDLDATSISLSYDPVGINQTETITVTFNEVDGTAVSNRRIEYYLSTDASIGYSDYYIGYDNVTLSANSSGTESTSFVPANISGISAGDYYVGVIIPDENEAWHRTDPLTISTSVADLEIPTTALSYDPVAMNQTETITVTVNEVGGSSVSGREIQYYLSTNSTITTSDFYIGNDFVYLSANGSGTESISFVPANISGISAGDYYVGIIIPDENEAWCRNDPLSIINASDLEIPSIAVTLDPVEMDQTETISITLNEVGGSSVSNREVEYYLSTDETINTSDFYIGNDYVSLSANGSGTESISFVPSNITGISEGDYYIGIIIPDENEAWCRNDPLTIISSPVPDLEISSIALSYDPVEMNQTETISITLNEVGGSSVSNREVEYYLSTDETINTSDFYIGNDYVFLSANGSGTESISFVPSNITGISEGDYYIGIIIPDENEAWHRIDPLTIISDNEPDLEIPNIALSYDPVNINQTETITATVNEVGGSSVSNREIQYYLSYDQTLTSDDIYIGNDHVNLTANGSGTESISFIPQDINGLSGGDYYVLINIPDENEYWYRYDPLTINETEPYIYVSPTSLEIYQSAYNNYNTSLSLSSQDTGIVTYKYIPPVKVDNKITDTNGNTINTIIIDGKPPKVFRAKTASPLKSASSMALPKVPAFDWSFGCSATAAAMIAGYYDNNGYPDIYTGPTNGGVMPMDNSSWGTMVDSGGDTRSICPLSATMQGVDGRTTRGHVDDYWDTYGHEGPDPYIINEWQEHDYEGCTADFMKTNQSKYKNSDATTIFYYNTNGSPTTLSSDEYPSDGLAGLKDFFESRGYTVESYYSQYINGYDGNTVGFTFAQYQQEIDAGRPVLIHVEGHTMVGTGYDDNNLVYLHDTWDYNTHSMTWGGEYPYGSSGLQHYGVSVIQLEGSVGANSFTISNQGGGTLVVSSIQSDQSWLSTNISSASVNAGGSETVDVSINWSVLSSQQTGTITINSNDSDEPSVSVSVTAIPDVPETVTISLSSNPTDGGNTTGDGEYSIGESVTVKATPNSGYTFSNWTENGTNVSSSNTYTFTAQNDRDLVANFEEDSPCEIDWSVNPANYQYSGEVNAKVELADGTFAQQGKLGAFVGDECRGVADLTYFPPADHYVASILTYSNLASGEEISFKFLNYDNCEILDGLSPTVQFTANMINGSAIEPIILVSAVNYTKELAQGWTWFSVNVDGEDMSLASVFKNVALSTGDYIKNQTQSATYYEGSGWYGHLSTIDPKSMYMVKLVKPDTIEFKGKPVDISNTSILLNEGWTWIGYLPQNNQTVADAFSSINLANDDYIKNQEQSATYYDNYGWYGSLNYLEPSKGYMIKMSNSSNLTYTETNSLKSGKLDIIADINQYVNPSEFEFNGSVTAIVNFNADVAFEENDKILAFVNGECRGVAQALWFEPGQTMLYNIMVYSNNREGEQITFKYFDSSETSFYTLDGNVEFTSDMVIANANNPYKLSMLSSNDELTDNKLSYSIYPNPAKEFVSIEYTLKQPSKIQIDIYDSLGRLTESLVKQKQENGLYTKQWNVSSYPRGHYLVKLTTDQEVKVEKIVIE